MVAEQLISRQGPLGHVWLAANYDKRLSKQQMLNTSIIKSSEIILSHPVSYTSLQTLQSSDAITLRLSGQLLLGIVRIYARKTKYLLDDVNDILLRLKNSFKYSSGINLGFENSHRLVNANPQQTMIMNLENITLHDQITDFELLYQDELNLDDDGEILSSEDTSNESTLFNQSIEYPRREDPIAGNDINMDMDLELDFDLPDTDEDLNNNAVENSTMDESIEIGREAPPPQIETPDISVLEGLKSTEAEFGLDLEAPLETIEDTLEEVETDQERLNAEPERHTPSAPERQSRRRNGISEEGELITNKRKLKVDSKEELEGISINTLRENQENLLNSKFQYGASNLTDKERLELIYNLSAPITNKRRKLWDINSRLLRLCQEEARLQERELEEQHELQFEHEGNDFSNLDFDISLPDFDNSENFENERQSSPNVVDDDDRSILQNDVQFDEITDNTAVSTTQIASQLRDHFVERHDPIEVRDIIQNDLNIQQKDTERFPLGTTNKLLENKFVSHRKEAAKCFFELLVLATNDCITIEQEQEPESYEIGGKVNIKSRDKLFHNFL